MSDTETTENEAQETVVIVISDFKKQKRNAKSLLTRLLTQLSCLLSEENPNRENICDLLVKIDEQKDICLEVLDKLEEAYQKSGDKQNALRIGDESDKIAEQVDVETHAS
ncbi:Hypothetical predicted protein, partial [Paramuricea clavata]